GISGDNVSGSPALSADGGVLAFVSSADDLTGGDHNGTVDVFARGLTIDPHTHALTLGPTTLVSVTRAGTSGNGDSLNPVVSADGRFVAFESSASDLVAGDSNGPNGTDV